MPSFDIVSEIDHHELANAVDQANREIQTRFDFRGIDASFALEGNVVSVTAEAEFQLQQMRDILFQKLTKRGIELGAVESADPVVQLSKASQVLTIREGVDTALAKDLVKRIKASKLKVQAAIQGDQVRVTGKKRDELQAVIALLKGAEIELPLQYRNFRD